MRQSCATGLVRSFVYNVCHFRTEENQRLSPNNENVTVLYVIQTAQRELENGGLF